MSWFAGIVTRLRKTEPRHRVISTLRAELEEQLARYREAGDVQVLAASIHPEVVRPSRRSRRSRSPRLAATFRTLEAHKL